jgi:hypothetical protein
MERLFFCFHINSNEVVRFKKSLGAVGLSRKSCYFFLLFAAGDGDGELYV